MTAVEINTMSPATWRDLLGFLRQLESDTRLFDTGDIRLDDPIIVDVDGQFHHADYLFEEAAKTYYERIYLQPTTEVEE